MLWSRSRANSLRIIHEAPTASTRSTATVQKRVGSLQRWSRYEEDREYCRVVSECRSTTQILLRRTIQTKGTEPVVWEVINRGKLDTGDDMAYLISGGQQEVVEDGGCRKLMMLAMGFTQGLKGDENSAHLDRVPGVRRSGEAPRGLDERKGTTGNSRLG